MMPRATSCIDLPLAAVLLITQLARGKTIRGTNRYACVCRQWRDADSRSEELQPLQLFAVLRHMSDADITRAFSWMAAHGQQVESLVLGTSLEQPLPVDLLSRAAPSLTSLTWLEVSQRHSLVLLAPVLGQLPQLKHLVAAVDLGVNQAHDMDVDVDTPDAGWFFNQLGKRWTDVPDLQQLCPQLVEFRLNVDEKWPWVAMDERVAQLLPTTLEQLTLAARWDNGVCLAASNLQHLTGLQQLTLDGVEMCRQEIAAMMQSLTGLQQLQVFSAPASSQGDTLMEVAPKLTGAVWDLLRGVGPVSQLVNLRTLILIDCGLMPPGTAEALSALTSLQCLGLEGKLGGDAVPGVLQQVAGISGLHNLRLRGSVEYPSRLSSSLAQCTQLTALVLVVMVPGGDGTARYVPVPPTLRGLSSLMVPAGVVWSQAGAWLAPLSHLTCLCVRLPHQQGQLSQVAIVKGHVCLVQCWPAILQQVLYAVDEPNDSSNGGRLQPALWQFTPAVPGAAPVSVRLEADQWACQAWSQSLVSCQHLPGVWELQGNPQGSCWSRSKPCW